MTLETWRRFLGNPANRLALGVLVVLVLSAVLGPTLSNWKPEETTPDLFSPPSRAHWMGTDLHGRDLFVRVATATRLSLGIGLAGAVLGVALGTAWGLVAGFAGGRTDFVMMRMVDLLYAIPSVVLVLLALHLAEVAAEQGIPWIARLPESSRRQVILVAVVGGLSWPTLSRLVRAQVLRLKERPFVLASRSVGAGPVRLVFRHILPNLHGIVLVNLTLILPAVLLQESFLSVLGLGIRPPSASLGTLIADGAAQLNPVRIRLWLLAFPGLHLAAMLWAFGRAADGLRVASEEDGTQA